MMDIARDPRWGRIAEGSGEDPYLGARMAAARVRGFQGDDYSAPDRMVACPKHYVGYGAAEGGRDYNRTEISEHTLRTVYLPPFRAAVGAGAGTIMSAFNDLNGVPASANPFTLRQVLRREWGFDGVVLSDWEAVSELVDHGAAADQADAVREAITAGVDMDMVSGTYAKHLPRLVREGKVPLKLVDEAVRRVLRVKFRLGLFERPYTDPTREASSTLTPEHLRLALEDAHKAIVLLRNERGLLPLDKGLKSVAVIGPLADERKAPLGPWSAVGRAEEVASVLQGVKTRLPGAQVLYARGCDIEGDDGKGIAEAVAVARRADLALLVVGESAQMSGEAGSRAYLDLPGRQRELVRAVAEAGVPVVLVLMNGRPLTIPWESAHVPAVVEAWFLGTQTGNAVADVLFGDYNPSGKLPVTFPRTVGQVPIYYNHTNTGRPPSPDNKYTSRYVDEQYTPLYPFGFGLSYTTFRYTGLALSAKRIRPDGRIGVSAEVENTGRLAGDEVVQLYIRDLAASVTRPVRELKGFRRVTLAPGERRRVEFTLTPAELGSYDRRMRFVVEPGAFKVWVGPSSAEGLEADFEVVR
jgi:beta-glucosidase